MLNFNFLHFILDFLWGIINLRKINNVGKRLGLFNLTNLKIFTTLVIPFIFVGCTPKVIQISFEERMDLKKEPNVQAVYYSPPVFKISHLDRVQYGAAFGLVGGMISAATIVDPEQKIIEEFGIKDPSLKIGRDVISDIMGKLELKNIKVNKSPLSNDQFKSLKQGFGEAFVIDFKSMKWGLLEYQGNYYPKYVVRARVINLKESRVTWQGLCEYGKEEIRYPHQLSDFTLNQGAFLKEKLAQVATKCTKVLLAQFFKNRR